MNNSDTRQTADEIEAKYIEIDMLREERNRTISDYVAWEIYDYDTDAVVDVVDDHDEAIELASDSEERAIYGLLEDDGRLAELREEFDL